MGAGVPQSGWRLWRQPPPRPAPLVHTFCRSGDDTAQSHMLCSPAWSSQIWPALTAMVTHISSGPCSTETVTR